MPPPKATKPARSAPFGTTFVPDEGSGRERIIIIGEAPGAEEVAKLRPFIGASGQMLTRLVEGAGLRRQDCYWTNVFPFRPFNNKIETVDRRLLAPWIDALHQRIAGLDDPWVLVPTGNTALRALIGQTGISKHRGSIYGYRDQRGRTLKVIPTLHPAYLPRQPE